MSSKTLVSPAKPQFNIAHADEEAGDLVLEPAHGGNPVIVNDH